MLTGPALVGTGRRGPRVGRRSGSNPRAQRDFELPSTHHVRRTLTSIRSGKMGRALRNVTRRPPGGTGPNRSPHIASIGTQGESLHGRPTVRFPRQAFASGQPADSAERAARSRWSRRPRRQRCRRATPMPPAVPRQRPNRPPAPASRFPVPLAAVARRVSRSAAPTAARPRSRVRSPDTRSVVTMPAASVPAMARSFAARPTTAPAGEFPIPPTNKICNSIDTDSVAASIRLLRRSTAAATPLARRRWSSLLLPQ